MFILQSYKGVSSWIRFFGVVVLVILAYIIGQLPITALITIKAAESPELQSEILNSGNSVDFSALNADQNLVFFLLLMMFVAAFAALYKGVEWLNKRSLKTVATSRKSFDWSRFFFGFSIWFLISMMVEFYSYWQSPENYTLQFQPLSFLVLLLIATFILPIQTSFEELFIRGYMMQELGFLTRSRWFPLILSSLIFGSMHMMNPEVQAFGWKTMLTYYVLIAMFLGIITLIDDGLELAIGIHTATNFYGATMVTFNESAIQTPALFRMNEVDASHMTILSAIMCLVFLLLAQRRYHFDWRLLTGPFKPESFPPPALSSAGLGTVESQLEFMTLDQDGQAWLTSQSLIKPESWFHSAEPVINFELALPEILSENEGYLILSEEKRKEVLSRISEFANTELIRFGEKLRLSLSDGSEVHLILHPLIKETHIPRPDLNWETYTLAVVPVTPAFYQVYQRKTFHELPFA